MMRQLHVVYEKGVLRPLEPVDFAEKQVFVVIVTDEEVVATVKPESTTYRTLAVEMQ